MRPPGEKTQAPKLAKQWAEPESVKRWAGQWGEVGEAERGTDEASGKASDKLARQWGNPQTEKQRGSRQGSRRGKSTTPQLVKR